jgi:hypothetical protein
VSIRRPLRALVALFDRAARLLAALLGTYPSAQYARFARWCNREDPQTPRPPGFIILQIDGISYDHLRAGLARGYAPYLRRLLERGEMRLHPWKPGIPGTTPVSQAGIMYGDSTPMPAYRWYDKTTGQARVATDPETAQSIQSTLSQRAPGILRGGASYMNVFDGDASRVLFTLGTFGAHRLFEGLRSARFLLLFGLNPLRTTELLLLAIWEYLTDLAQRTQAWLANTTPRPLNRAFAFFRVMTNVVMRELQTFSVCLDISSGLPAIYTTYFGFDEVAHQYGPSSKPALRALHAIDRRVRRIDMYRRMNIVRPYELYLLSDHGMTDDVPFASRYGQTLGALVQDLVGRSVALRELFAEQHPDLSGTLFVRRELLALGAQGSPPLARLSQYVLQYLESRLPREIAQGEYAPATESDVVISSSGSMSHIYLNARPDKLDIQEIGQVYPSLVVSLLAHPGIWLVIGREKGQTVIFDKEGALYLGKEARVDGSNPLDRLAYSDWAARKLAHLATLPESGDLILLGAYDPDERRVICFEEQWACHGGLGGPQDVAMFMTESHIDWPLAGLESATEVYDLFAQRYAIQGHSRNASAESENHG